MIFTPWILGMLVWLILAGSVCLGKRNNGLIDIFWGLGFVLLASISFCYQTQHSVESYAVTGLVLLWGLRLSVYLFSRNWNKPEDFRYAAWRKGWGKNWILFSILKVFLLQGAIMQVIAIPIFVVNVIPMEPVADLSKWVLIGGFVALAGILIEAIADYQKSKFKQDPANAQKLCRVGLWSISRHPNYLGEILTWVGIGVIPLQIPYGYFALIAPASILFLLYFVSGVPLLEKRLEGRPDFEDYKKTTGAIFPKF